jgi:hypothetical protein
MTAESSSSSLDTARKQVACTPSPLSPAQAIAEAWKRESNENQEKWRRIDAGVKVRYNKPVRILDRKTKM